MKTTVPHIAVVLLILASNIAWCSEIDLSEDKPITVTTGVRTGRVTDAITGKPIEGAIVVCNWKITEFGTDRFGAVYEAITDKDGKYTIPNQSVDLEHSLFSLLTPEQMIVYKLGYVWYWMSDKEITTFIVCVPDLPHIYRKENNIVKLQPWNDGMSHAEHMDDFPSYELPMDKLKLLPQTLAEEKKLVKEEGYASAGPQNKAYKARKRLEADTEAYKNGLLSREEYINKLHNYLNISSASLLMSVSTALKDFNDTVAILALIEFVKKNVYRKYPSTNKVFRHLCSEINNPHIIYPPIISHRKELIAEVEKWWNQNKDKDPAEWKSDDLTKLSRHMAAQTYDWEPLYDISGEFRLVSGEIEDVNDSPVMTVFKKFKTALLEDDVDTIRDCFIDIPGQIGVNELIELRPKFREIVDGFKSMRKTAEDTVLL